MISRRFEGNPFHSGLNVQWGGGLKNPYISFHWVHVFGQELKRFSIRLRFWSWANPVNITNGAGYQFVYGTKKRLGPKFFFNKVQYNIVEEHLKNTLSHQISYKDFELLQAHKEDVQREQQRMKCRLEAHAKAMIGTPTWWQRQEAIKLGLDPDNKDIYET